MVWEVPCHGYKMKSPSSMFYIDEDLFWTPRVSHKNAPHNFGMQHGFTSRFFVTASPHQDTLRFTWQRFGAFLSTCDMDFTDFPFDTQFCEINLILHESKQAAVFYYAEFHVHRSVLSFDDNWDLIGTESVIDQFPFDGHNRSYVKLKIQLSRKPHFYIYNLMLPCVCLTILELFSFSMAPAMPDRPVFAMTILLALTFMQGQILGHVPAKPQQIFLFQYTYYQIVFCLLCTVYHLISCGFSRAHPLWSQNPVELPKWFTFASTIKTIPNGRIVDAIFFSLALFLLLFMNAHALATAVRTGHVNL